jgi:hypothetical protein
MVGEQPRGWLQLVADHHVCADPRKNFAARGAELISHQGTIFDRSQCPQ